MTLERAPDLPPLTADEIAQIAAAVYSLMQQNAPLDPELRLYTTEQAAELLGKTAWWVKDQARKGAIPVTRVGRSIHMSAAQIRETRAANEVDPGTRRRPSRAPKRRPNAA